MDEIKYNIDTKEILFSGRVTSFKFYTQLFKALREFYQDNGRELIPAFSFVYVDDFESLVLPNLLAIGLILKKIHSGRKIPLSILNTIATKFLESTRFFDNVGNPKIIGEKFNVDNTQTEIVKEIGLEIFDFNPKYLGFYNYTNIQKSYNPNHKIQIFENCSYEYYKNYIDKSIPSDELEKVLDTIRTKKYNELKPKVEKYFYQILYYGSRRKQDVKFLSSVLTEIICNSVLYSDSLCAAMLQSKDGKTTISVSDIGIGFAGSFKHKPNFDYYVTDKFENPYKEKLKNYLLIFDALHYSKNKERENLFSLLKLVIETGGKMRFHYDNVQVVFTSNRCRNCDIIPLRCAKCLLDNLSDDKNISPVRFFDSTFQGIHIEVDLDF